jgi:hypothetical protein
MIECEEEVGGAHDGQPYEYWAAQYNNLSPEERAANKQEEVRKLRILYDLIPEVAEKIAVCSFPLTPGS